MSDDPNANVTDPDASAARKAYRIALTMSGAISAGAYTAGVFDFLIQALTELELARERGDTTDVPGYDIRIVAMAGASAGGITAALGTVALGYGVDFETAGAAPGQRKLKLWRTVDDVRSPIDCVLPRLYDTWVRLPRMFDRDDPKAGLLSVSDLDDVPTSTDSVGKADDKRGKDDAGSKKQKVNSLLNWKVLNDIRDAALSKPENLGEGVPYKFLADPLHVYLTISNLRGVPYYVTGANDSSAYHMLSHGDRLHFWVHGIGRDRTVASEWAAKDQGIHVKAEDLRQKDSLPNEWGVLGDAALATAAFPGGLSARLLRATRADFEGRWFPAPKFSEGTSIEAKFPDGFAVKPPDFGFVNVDGGVINNDPFEYARYALLEDPEKWDARNERDPEKADRAVIMIAPFPEGATFDTEERLDIGLLTVAKALLPTLISQARFKLTELAAAADARTASRWLIAPRRTNDLNELPSSTNIACGLLGGFGGFLDESFRQHDFQLGRRNCQGFLLALKSSVFTPGQTKPVIPLLGSALPEIQAPAWPCMSRDNLAVLMQRIEDRANVVVPALIKQEAGSGLIGFAVGTAWSLGGRSKLLKIVRGAILGDLLLRAQIEDGLPSNTSRDDPRRLIKFSPNERKVVAAMADPRYDLFTVKGIAARTRLEESVVQDAISKALALRGDLVHRVRKGPISADDKPAESNAAGQTSDTKLPTYRLHSRGLGVRNWWMIGPAVRQVDSLTVDWPPPE